MAIVVALSLCASAATAQSVSIGPLVGISKSSDAEAKVLFGAALRAKLIGALGVEAAISYRQEDIDDNAGTLRSWPIQLTGLLHPLPFVYAGIGIGWYNTTFDFADSAVQEDESQQEFGWHFGGGLEIPMGSSLMLVGDLRYIYLDYDFETVPGVGDVTDDFYMATVGLLFNL